MPSLLSSVYQYCPPSRLISPDEINLLGTEVPAFYAEASTKFGVGSLAGVFDIREPQELIRDAGLYRQEGSRLRVQPSLLENATLFGHGLHGQYWFKPSKGIYAIQRLDETIYFGHDNDRFAERLFSESIFDRPVFRPVGETRVRFIASPDMTFTELCDLIRTFKVCDYHQVSGTANDKRQWAEFYFPAFGGQVAVTRSGTRIKLTGERDTSLGQAAFRLFMSSLDANQVVLEPHKYGQS